jgi:hypothetical protein
LKQVKVFPRDDAMAGQSVEVDDLVSERCSVEHDRQFLA